MNAFSGASTRAQAKRSQQRGDLQDTQESPKSEPQEGIPLVNPTPVLRKKPFGWVKDLAEEGRFSSLYKLVRAVSRVCLAAKQWLKNKCRGPKQSKWEVRSSKQAVLAYQRFTSLRGHPRKLWSDPGTNFVGARPALEKLQKFRNRLNKHELEDRGARHGAEWSWKIHPADSPHRNGAAEAAVRVMKRALSNLGGDGVFTWGEFRTFLSMAANLASERPIDTRTQSREDCVEDITPNSLQLGRANPRGDSGDFLFDGYPYKRLKQIQATVSHFWKKWSQLAGPNLFIRNKWHTRERNVAVRDVVWLADQNALRGQYKLARVVSVNADSKGIVRDVLVKTVPSYPVHITRANECTSRSKLAACHVSGIETNWEHLKRLGGAQSLRTNKLQREDLQVHSKIHSEGANGLQPDWNLIGT
ncbi:hypothetical protein DPEC_G00294530 [Dallia pectoralis]|uniref:Uncharacterized protein n=1 Tax=Dallia pectoralis TaxID=75939 RepID=A0ACC2FII1_DALPE|nr:hypothetical protein DPEC_G00294530 [Dallia pectoralis]